MWHFQRNDMMIRCTWFVFTVDSENSLIFYKIKEFNSKKVPDSSSRLTPVCFGFFETLRPLSCFSGRHSSVSSSFSSSLGDISSSMLMVAFSCALAVVKRLDLGYRESTMLCSNNHKLKLLQVNLQDKLTFGGTYSNESSGLFSLLVLGTRIFFSLARCTIESFCRHGQV